MLVLTVLIVSSLWSYRAEPPRVVGPLPTIGPLWILGPVPEGYPLGPGPYQAPAPDGHWDRLSYSHAEGSRILSIELERGPFQKGAQAWKGPPEGLAGVEAFAGLFLGSPEAEVLTRLGPPGGIQEGRGRRTCSWFRSCDEQGRLVPDDSEAAKWALAFQVTFVDGVAVRYSVSAD